MNTIVRRSTIGIVLGLLLAMSGAHATTINVSDVPGLNNAIATANPGDTIVLAPGTYLLTGTLTITTADLEIQGPQAGVDPRTAAGLRTPGGPNEAVLDGQGSLGNIFLIDASDVVLDGLDITNGTGDLVRQSNIHANTTVRYSFVRDSSGDEGIQLTDCLDCFASFNRSFNNAGDGINISDSTNGTIDNNEVHDNGSTNASIYVYSNDGINVTNNLVYNGTSGSGIKLGGSSSSPNDGAVVTGNTVENITSGSSTDAAMEIADQTGTGIYVVSNNVFRNSNRGLIVRASSIAGQVVISNNDITGNTEGMVNLNASQIIAENNWWGDASGPLESTGIVECLPDNSNCAICDVNADGLGDTIASGDVDYCPWLGASANAATPTPTPSPTVTPSPTPSPTNTVLPTSTPSPSPTITPGGPTPTPTPVPVDTPAGAAFLIILLTLAMVAAAAPQFREE